MVARLLRPPRAASGGDNRCLAGSGSGEKDARSHQGRLLRLPAVAGAPPAGTCYGLRYSDGRLLAVQYPGSSIGTVDLRLGSYTPVATDVGVVALTYGSANWAFGFGSDWIGTYTTSGTGLQTNLLERLDSVTGEITEEIHTGIGINLAVDPSSGLWATGTKQGLQDAALVHIDPTSGEITSSTLLHHYPCCPNDEVGRAVAVGHGNLWVALDSP
jgi:hypothetical protein